MDFRFLKNHRFEFVGACHVRHDRECGGQFHVNDDTHLMHVTVGRARLLIFNQDREIRAGDVLAVPPFTRYAMRITPPFEMRNFHFKLWLEGGAMLEERARLPIVSRSTNFTETILKLKSMTETDVDGAERTLRGAALAHEIVAEHILEQGLVEVLSQTLDSRMIRLIERLRSMAANDFDARELARFCHLSESQMNRKFRESFKTSPRRFWERQRLRRVCATLKKTDKPLSEVADEHGFADQAHFSRWFKALAGVTPGRFRKARDMTF